MSTSLLQALVGIGIIWFILHSIKFLWSTSRRHDILPTVLRHPPSPPTTIALRKLRLTIRTTACNKIYAQAVAILSRKQYLHRVFRVFYDIGGVLSICGSLLVLLLLLVSCYESIVFLLNARILRTPDLLHHIVEKRELTQDQVIQPIIPGLTVPSSDIPLLVFVVLFSQIVHESGHAIAGALDRLSISEIGISLTIVIPSAFVGFPISSFEALPLKARRRIVAAGPFHNLVFWVCLLLMDEANLSAFIYVLMGYQDMSRVGLVVVGVDPGSPLYSHLPTGALITQLDDIVIGNHHEVWSEYLRNSSQVAQQGWCTQRLAAPDQRCCNEGNEIALNSCFISWNTSGWKGCLDPIPILTTADGPRCKGDANCFDDDICVLPIDDSLLRVAVTHPKWSSSERIVLWKGPRTELSENVQVSSFRPRLSFMPLGLPPFMSKMSWYLKQVSLCLFFFNLLPMRNLDGDQLWQLFLREGADVYDFEAALFLHHSSPWLRIYRGVAQIVPWLLMGCGMLLALRMSS